MRVILVFLLMLITIEVFCQKPTVDFSAAYSWPKISEVALSNDGRYLSYVISSDSIGRELFIRSVGGNLRLKYKGLSGSILFNPDSRRAFFQHNDTLEILELDSGEGQAISGVVSFKISREGDGRFLAYLSKDNTLRLLDFYGGTTRVISGVRNYWFSEGGRVMLIDREFDTHSELDRTVSWMDVLEGQEKMIWKGAGVSNVVFDKSENQVVFLAGTESNVNQKHSVVYYKRGMPLANIWLSDGSGYLGSSYQISLRDPHFSLDGGNIFFFVKRAGKPERPEVEASSVNVWRYGADFLAPWERLNWQSQKDKSMVVAIKIGDSVVRSLEPAIARFIELSPDKGATKAVFATYVNTARGYRNPADWPDIYVEDTHNALLKCIAKGVPVADPHFSPEGRYIYWYNRLKKAYFAYDVNTGIFRNISGGVARPLYNEIWDVGELPNPYGVMGWIAGDSAILVYDRYDVWMLDPSGKALPINVTAGFGRQTKTILRYVYTNSHNYLNEPALSKNARFFLCAFDERTRDNGFFIKRTMSSSPPERLTMKPELFYFSDQLGVGMPRLIIKARNADVYIVPRMSTKSFPNLQITSDFKNFDQITNLAPQSQYNWLSSELWHWRTFTGRVGDAILYKPENFDPRKKYPVIFYFYQRMTAGLNKFLDVELSIGGLSIPWYVSNGYIVVCPDIYYRVGQPRESIYDYVGSAAMAIGREAWIDSKAVGVQGHSWGGLEVNCLITRTGIFAAACSAEGVTDLVSMSASFQPVLADPFAIVEQGVHRMGRSIWQDPVGYALNSPVYHADKISTPLLMMDNPNDQNVPWAQGVELFLALNRLGKKVWLLEYEGEGHTLENKKNQYDFSVRMSQFFDHYLKDKPAPKWMTEGIPARLKGIDSGLEGDTTHGHL